MHYDNERTKEHFVNKSLTPRAEKDLWRTPRDFFNALNKEFNFSVDVCADKGNTLCPVFFSEKDSALNNEWFAHHGATWFMNPPYSQAQEFLRRAEQQAKKHNITVVALVNANTDTKWFADAEKTANEIRLITGRISFYRPDGRKAKMNTKGQSLIIWRGNCKTKCVISMISRDELLKEIKCI